MNVIQYVFLEANFLLQSYLRWEGSGAAARLAKAVTDITGGMSPAVSLQRYSN